jgi:hypothetical protein
MGNGAEKLGRVVRSDGRSRKWGGNVLIVTNWMGEEKPRRRSGMEARWLI